MQASIICPIEPHEMDKRTRHDFDDLVSRVVMVESERGRGNDLLLRVFLAGLYVGAFVTAQRRPAPHPGDKEE